MRRILPLVAAAAALALPAVAGGDDPTGSRQDLATPIVSPRGVGPVHLGDSIRSLHRRHLIRRLRPGCEFAPSQRVARLRPPLNGFAFFDRPHGGVSALSVRGTAMTARGIGVGSTPAEARQAYPHAEYNPPGTYDPFAEGFFWVNSSRSARMAFIVDPDTRLITTLTVPQPSFCE